MMWVLIAIGYVGLGATLAVFSWSRNGPSNWSPRPTRARQTELFIKHVAMGVLWLPYLLYLGIDTFAREV